MITVDAELKKKITRDNSKRKKQQINTFPATVSHIGMYKEMRKYCSSLNIKKKVAMQFLFFSKKAVS